MRPLSTDELRQAYIDFFRSRGHVAVPSASLLPENDPTTLFTGSGMQPMLPYLLGEPHPLGKCIVDSQKSFRSVDIEEVGDNRHTTFFEMLGNWSFGAYFKAEQIPWIFHFLTTVVGLDPQRLFVSVFHGKEMIPRDDASVALWKEQFSTVGIDARAVDDTERRGLQDGHIFYYSEKKNWWSRTGEPEKMPVGEPGGPDSEMFWDFGAHHGMHERSPWHGRPCHVNCDCGRFLEIGNNVFMEYIKTPHGFDRLAQRNVDFGGGLERMAAAIIDNPDIFMIDVFAGMRSLLQELSGKIYGVEETYSRACRIIMDHLRASVFLINDGALPSNKDQGYFTRRMLRRAIRFGDRVGLSPGFCPSLGEAVITAYQRAYPELIQHRSMIMETLRAEEVQFRTTLTKGERALQEYLRGHDGIDGAKAFFFFETYGFPLELTIELAHEQGRPIDEDIQSDFRRAFTEHQKLSRAGAAQRFAGGLADHSAETTKLHTATHLLNAALRKVLGPHVQQKGSNITAERLRFDFSHPAKVTPEQIAEVERLVNTAIAADLPVAYHVTTVAVAKEEGAIGVFDEKYGTEVKVYVIGPSARPLGSRSGRCEWSEQPFSIEICGGPHVARTGMIGTFTIQKEEAVSAGVRRIKAVVTGGPQAIDVAKAD